MKPWCSEFLARCSAGNGKVACCIGETFVRQRPGAASSKS